MHPDSDDGVDALPISYKKSGTKNSERNAYHVCYSFMIFMSKADVTQGRTAVVFDSREDSDTT